MGFDDLRAFVAAHREKETSRRRAGGDSAYSKADLLLDWVPDEKARQRVLVENPPVLYGF
jgi:hypothetical protein